MVVVGVVALVALVVVLVALVLLVVVLVVPLVLGVVPTSTWKEPPSRLALTTVWTVRSVE